MDPEADFWTLIARAEERASLGEGGEFVCPGPDGREVCAPTMEELRRCLWTRCFLMSGEQQETTPPPELPLPNSTASLNVDVW
jgi:hypothetical protein